MGTNTFRNGMAITIVLFLCSLGEGCRRPVTTEGQQFHILFEGFEFLLADDLSAAMSIQELESAALRNSHPAERALIPGRVYSFRKITKISDEDLGIRILPARLREVGALVTKAPQSSKDFIYLYTGGPLFVIQFEKDGHQGTMLNRVHTSPKPGEQWEELIVAYK